MKRMWIYDLLVALGFLLIALCPRAWACDDRLAGCAPGVISQPAVIKANAQTTPVRVRRIRWHGTRDRYRHKLPPIPAGFKTVQDARAPLRLDQPLVSHGVITEAISYRPEPAPEPQIDFPPSPILAMAEQPILTLASASWGGTALSEQQPHRERKSDSLRMVEASAAPIRASIPISDGMISSVFGIAGFGLLAFTISIYKRTKPTPPARPRISWWEKTRGKYGALSEWLRAEFRARRMDRMAAQARAKRSAHLHGGRLERFYANIGIAGEQVIRQAGGFRPATCALADHRDGRTPCAALAKHIRSAGGCAAWDGSRSWGVAARDGTEHLNEAMPRPDPFAA